MTAPTVTTADVLTWVHEHIGKTPPAVRYGVQSPDLVNLYLADVWGADHVRGNGDDLAHMVGNRLGWTLAGPHTTTRAGDIVSLLRDDQLPAGCPLTTSAYGHTGVVVADAGPSIVVFDVSGIPGDMAGAQLHLYPRDAVAAIATAPIY